MFRKPMRLEKWVAFDGAFGVEVVEAAVESNTDSSSSYDPDLVMASSEQDGGEAGVASQSEFGEEPASLFSLAMFSPFSSPTTNEIEFDISGKPGYSVEIEFPIGISVPAGQGTDPFFAFWDADIDIDIDGGNYGNYLYFEIAKPANGTLSWFDTTTNHALLKTHYGLNLGDMLAFTQTQSADSFDIFTGSLVNTGSYWIDYSTGSRVAIGKTVDGGVRFSLLNNGNAEENIKLVLRSIVYTPASSGQTDGGSFALNVYYNESPYHNDFGNFDNTGLYQGSPAGSIEDASKVCDTDGKVVDPGVTPGPPPEPEPEPEPEFPGVDEPDPSEDPAPGGEDPNQPGDVVDPIPPPSLPNTDSSATGNAGGDSSSDDSEGSGEMAGESGDAADAGGQVGSDQGDLVYIYRREDEDRDERGNASQHVDDKELQQAGEAALTEMKQVGTAAVAAIMELERDFAAVLTSVRGDRASLEQALAALREEYLLRDAGRWGGVRNVLRELFESGNQEMEAVNRVLAQMHRQSDEFRGSPGARRDGMLTENLKELIDSASRRSGETGAMSEALNAVVALFRERRQSGAAPVGEAEVTEVFERAHSAALSRWYARAARTDPMGRELSGLLAGAKGE